MSTPAEFFRSHGLVVDDPRNDARWHRVPTIEKPKKKNGTYRWDNDIAFCKNWSAGPEVHAWRPETTVRPITAEDRAAAAKRRREREDTQEKGWERAAARARSLLNDAKPTTHGYAMRKGFPKAHVLVLPDGEMFVPMRSLADGKLVGAQIISWDAEDRVWRKKFIPGMRAKGAIFCIGPANARETVLCEGWATGMSLEEAVGALKISMNVLVCFSDGNLVHVASMMFGSRCYVYADNDPPETDPEKIAKGSRGEAGRYAAEKTGFPWTMSPKVGNDANDDARDFGIRAVAGRLLELRRKKA